MLEDRCESAITKEEVRVQKNTNHTSLPPDYSSRRSSADSRISECLDSELVYISEAGIGVYDKIVLVRSIQCFGTHKSVLQVGVPSLRWLELLAKTRVAMADDSWPSTVWSDLVVNNWTFVKQTATRIHQPLCLCSLAYLFLRSSFSWEVVIFVVQLVFVSVSFMIVWFTYGHSAVKSTWMDSGHFVNTALTGWPLVILSPVMNFFDIWSFCHQ